MSLFDCDDYKSWVNDWIAEQPSGGHGQLRQLALHLGINSVVMSQVFRGSRDLTLEQALGVAKFVCLTELERDYFLLLVQKARAGSHELKKVFEAQILLMRKSSQILKNRIKHQVFSNDDRATFYSHWQYSAIRLSASMPSLNSVSAIADHLHLERSLVAKVI